MGTAQRATGSCATGGEWNTTAEGTREEGQPCRRHTAPEEEGRTAMGIPLHTSPLHRGLSEGGAPLAQATGNKRPHAPRMGQQAPLAQGMVAGHFLCGLRWGHTTAVISEARGRRGLPPLEVCEWAPPAPQSPQKSAKKGTAAKPHPLLHSLPWKHTHPALPLPNAQGSVHACLITVTSQGPASPSHGSLPLSRDQQPGTSYWPYPQPPSPWRHTQDPRNKKEALTKYKRGALHI